MGDRDGADERENDDSAAPQSGDSADDEQPVPSSTAADANADDDAADGTTEESVADDASDHSDEEASTDAPDDEATSPGERDDAEDAQSDDGGSDETASDDADDDTDDGADDATMDDAESANDTSTDDSDATDSDEDDPASDESDADSGDEPADADDSDDHLWTKPTIDDTVSDPEEEAEEFDGDRDPDDYDEWWEGDDPPDIDGSDGDDTADDSDEEGDESESDGDGDESESDDEDLDPAARRDQMQKGRGPGDGEVNRSKGPGGSNRTQSAKTAPKGAKGAGTTRPEERDYADEIGTAPDDEEMPLTEHVEEMALRLLAVSLVMFGVAGIVVFYAVDLINFLWYSFLGDGLAVCPGPQCGEAEAPRIYHPLSLVLARLKVSTLVGLIIALPVGVYQTYRFMRPGLYPRERRYYLAAVPTSLILAGVGVAFAYFAVLPALFSYFSQYSERAVDSLAFGLTETFNLIIIMLGFFAIIFQIPLLVMLAIMMGITTRKWLEDRRLYFWGGFAAVAFLFSPDPTGMAPLIVAVTMIVLFEGTLALLRWTGTGSPIPTAEEAASARPFAWVLAAVGGYVASAGPVPGGYYGQLPPEVTELLAESGGPVATPAIIAAALIGLFELGAFALRRYGRSRRALRARLAIDSARIPVWLAAVVVGYFGSPDPVLLEAADQVALPPAAAVGVGVGLIVLYELFVVYLRWREGSDEDADVESTTEM